MSFSRSEISFESAGQHCRGWLYLPVAAGPHPVIVMAHGFGAVKEMGLDAYAERFAQAGYACLVFDYRHFGASDGEPRQLLDIDSQLQDWASAIACARGRDELDQERVVLWGTSFAGGHALVAGARDGSVAAVISQCPFTDGPASVRVMEFRVLLRVSWLALRDAVGSLFGRAPVLVPSAGEPGSTAMMTAPDVVPGYLGLVPDGFEFRNEVAARIALHVLFYRPGRSAAKLQCPVLFCVCDADSVAPTGATLSHAARAPRGEIKRYPEGHFDIYTGEPFERVTTDQLEFLRRHIPTPG
ncbi:MAG: alpha/beta hydrolase [Xanthomonadales bacterium]|nr:alpha/beta hydrolase [Xanthomonadales bacterium]